MNIYKFEVKVLIRSVLIWSSSIAAGLVIYMMFFPLVMVDNAAMDTMMQNFPDELLAFVGMNGDLSFTSVMGYYGLTMSFIYIPVAIQAALYGFSIISVEERELTADFLLTKPVSRKQIFLSKFFAALTALTLVNIVIWISSYLSLAFFNSGMPVDYLGTTILLSSIILGFLLCKLPNESLQYKLNASISSSLVQLRRFIINNINSQFWLYSCPMITFAI
jgi:ABC-2 type transport system permease protein